MATDADKQRLHAIRRRFADASKDWQLGPNGLELHAVFLTNTPPLSMVELTADCGIPDRDFLLNAHPDIAFLLKLLDSAFAEVRRWKPVEKKKQDVSDDTRVEASVRFLLKVDSRGELNNDATARNAWFDLRAEFEAWRSHNG